MSLTDDGIFTFTWKIENFSMCPQKCGEYLSSPVFAVDILDKTEWQLVLYPRGRTTDNVVSYFLHKTRTGSDSSDITIGFEFIVFSADVSKLTKCIQPSQLFVSKNGYGWESLISRDAIWAQIDDYLPCDILTIQCRMWRVGNAPQIAEPYTPDTVCENPSDFETVLNREMFSNATAELLDFRAQFSSKKGSTRTVIIVRKRMITWPIRKFSSLRINQRFSIPLISPLVGVPSFLLTFYLSGSHDGDQCGQVEIRRNETDCSRQTFVKCRISVQNTLINDQYFTEDEHFFEAQVIDDIWKFPTIIKSSKLKDEKYLDVTNDILRLHCEFAISQLGDDCHTEDVDIIRHECHTVSWSNIPNPFENEFKTFYKDGEFSDVSLRAGNRVFKVHKIILSARSSFFRDLFVEDTQTGVVDVPHFDPDTVDRLLAYLYTDALDDMKPKDAVEMYSAAGAYKVLSLKLKCSCVLRSTLSVSNVCDVLRLAASHRDGDLMDAVQNFISANSREIFHSPEWKYLMKCNSSLAADVMYGILIKSV